MGDPTYPLTSVMNIIAAVLVSLSLVTSGIRGPYIRGVVMLKGWVLVGVVIVSIQTILWHDSYQNIAPVFCDISTHLAIGWGAGIPTCSLIMTRRLWHILSGDQPLDESQMRREAFFDYFLGLGVPALRMIAYYVVQDARFVILEDYGCDAAIDQNGVTVILLQVWPLLSSIVSVALYCWRICLYFYRHWHTIMEAFSGPAGIDHTRFMRILALSFIDTIISLPLGITAFCMNIVLNPKSPFWPGWTTIHRSWTPSLVSAETWHANPFRAAVYWNGWINVVYAMAIFALFGIGGNARSMYRMTFEGARRLIQRIRRRTSSGTGLITTVSVSRVDSRLPSRLSLEAKARAPIDEAFVLDSLNDTVGHFTVNIDVVSVMDDSPAVIRETCV